MNLWKNYQKLVHANVLESSVPVLRSVTYWRDMLFTTIVVYLLPVSMVAYLPAMVSCYVLNRPVAAIFNNVVFAIVLVLTFSPGMSLVWRKFLFMCALYMLSVMLFFVGVYGTGPLYLLSTVIFAGLIYPSFQVYLCIGINIIICVVFAACMHYHWIPFPLESLRSPMSWLAVATNLVLLSLLFTAAIRMLMDGFNITLMKESYFKEKIRLEGLETQMLVKELQIKNQELEQFAYIASHDLQEPLNSISGIVSVLKMAEVKNDREGFEQSLGFISHSVERLRALIKGLLDYSKLGRQLNPRLVNCMTLINNVENDLTASINASGAVLVIDKSVKNLPEMTVYPLEFNQLFQNLISNAIKFRHAGVVPIIEISAKEEQEDYEFKIKDNGIGIRPEFLEKIFIIFKRAHSEGNFEGTGIGLAFCKKIVELHGGNISADSQPGMGSTFSFTISKSIFTH